MEASDTPEARQAIELYVYRVGQQLGSLAASLGGLDALVFTAGIGENSASLRRRVCQDAAWLGVALDEDANQAQASGPRCISTPGSRVAVWVIPTNEELMIARHTQAVLQGRGAHDWRDDAHEALAWGACATEVCAICTTYLSHVSLRHASQCS